MQTIFKNFEKICVNRWQKLRKAFYFFALFLPSAFQRHQRRGTRDGDMKNEQYMLHLAVCVCTLEVITNLIYFSN